MCRDSVDLLGTWAAVGWHVVVFCCVCFFLSPSRIISLLDPDEKQRKKTTWPKRGSSKHTHKKISISNQAALRLANSAYASTRFDVPKSFGRTCMHGVQPLHFSSLLRLRRLSGYARAQIPPPIPMISSAALSLRLIWPPSRLSFA